MNKLDKIVTERYEFNNTYFGIFWLVASIIFFISATVYFVIISGDNTWNNYYELPFKFQFWFVAAIVLCVASVIAFVFVCVGFSDDDFDDEIISHYNPFIDYYVNGRRVDEKEYRREEDKYNDLLAPFIESLKESKKEI